LVNPNYKVNDLLAHHNLGLGVTVQRSHTSGTETIFVPLGIGKTSGIMEDGIQLEVHLEMLEVLSRLSRRAGSDLVIGKKKKKSKHLNMSVCRDNATEDKRLTSNITYMPILSFKLRDF